MSRAIEYRRFGGPEVLEMVDVPAPEPRDVDAVEEHLPGCGTEHARQAVEQRGLPGPGRPHDRGDGGLVEGHGDPVQHQIVPPESFRQIHCFQQGMILSDSSR